MTELEAADLNSRRKVILVIDMVESVKLMAEDEIRIVAWWRAMVATVRTQILPRHGGVFVKSLGDGMMLTFDTAHAAIAVVRAVKEEILRLNVNFPTNALETNNVDVRFGLNCGDVVADEIDVYGHTANLAARLSTLGGSGEVILGSSVRDALIDGIDGQLIDLGDCYVKHLSAPLRAWRLDFQTDDLYIRSQNKADATMLRLAVIPFYSASESPKEKNIGELLADGLIVELGRNPELAVISRLSTRLYSASSVDHALAAKQLNADLILHGSFQYLNDRLSVSFELLSLRTQHIVCRERVTGRLNELFEDHSPIFADISLLINQTLKTNCANDVLFLAPNNIQNYSLLLGGIELMYRSEVGEFQKARQAMDFLTGRESRSSAPGSWLAKWYVLNHTRNGSKTSETDRSIAAQLAYTSVERDSSCSFSWAVRGFVQLHLEQDAIAAQKSLDHALLLNPSDAFAWLFLTTVMSEQGLYEQALEAANKALELSPKDPYRHYFLGLAASASMAKGLSAESSACLIDINRAEMLAKESIRLNKAHSPTLRVLINALVHQDKLNEAQEVAKTLLAIQPDLTITQYLGGNWGAHWLRRESARALQLAGIPLT
jgi:adenylate cyclase